jgi:hypothetical protein
LKSGPGPIISKANEKHLFFKIRKPKRSELQCLNITKEFQQIMGKKISTDLSSDFLGTRGRCTSPFARSSHTLDGGSVDLGMTLGIFEVVDGGFWDAV